MKKIPLFLSVVFCLCAFISSQVHASIPGFELNTQAISIQVDPTSGSAALPIHIDVPPGRAGIEPNLTLAYNSNNHQLGLAGVGWNMDFGSIMVSTKKGVPKYDGTDNYMLSSGSPLILNQASGYYNLEIEGDFSKIEKKANHWLITDKKGTQYFYGNTDDSRQYDPAKSIRVFRWFLNKVIDIHGNTMTVFYVKDGNQIYADSIIYTGLEGPNAHMIKGPQAEIKFEYQAPRYPTISYMTGFLIKEARILKTITTYAGGTSANGGIRQGKYTFNYSPSTATGRDLLKSVKKEGLTDVAVMPIITFNYADSQVGWVDDSGWDLSSNTMFANHSYVDWVWGPVFTDLGVRAVDLNADGYPDFIRGYYEKVDFGQCGTVNSKLIKEVYLSDKNKGWIKDGRWVPTESWVGFTRNCEHFNQDTGVRLADINGDGWVDIVRGIMLTPWLGNDVTKNSSLNNHVDGFTAVGNWNLPSYFTYLAYDGFPPASPRGSPISFISARPFGVSFAEFDGDGYIDFIRSSDRDLHSIFTNGMIIGQPGWASVPNVNTSGPLLRGGKVTDLADGAGMADLNGDGLSDIIYMVNGSTMVFMNNGNGWDYETPDSPWAVNVPTSANLMDGTQFIDVNADGLLDLIVQKDENLVAHINTGYGWGAVVNLPAQSRFKDFSTQIFDANGDGLNDVMIHAAFKTSKMYVNANKCPVDSLVSVDNGIGAHTSIEYDSALHFSNTFLPFALPVVKSLTTTVNSENYKTSYSYSGGLWDAAYREFQGFKMATVTDPDGNYTITEFLQDHYFRGRPKEQSTYDSTGKLYRKTVNQWQSHEITTHAGQTSKFVFLGRTDNYIFDGASTAKRTRQESIYAERPQTGNLTETINYGEVDPDTSNDAENDTDTIISITEYVFNPNTWLTLPKHTSILDYNNAPVSQTWFYYDGATDNNAIPSLGLLTLKTDWLGDATQKDPKTSYVYDAIGNLQSTTDPAGNITSIVYDNDYRMFPVQVTNALNQTVKTTYYGIDGVSLDDGQGLHGLWGQAKSSVDANHQTVFSTYDSFGRPTAQVSPKDSIALPTAQNSYDIAADYIAVTSKSRVEHGKVQTIDKTAFYDGLGRLIESKSLGPKPGQYIIAGQSVYNNRGLAIKKYLPRFTNLDLNTMDAIDPTRPFSQAVYDPMGRVIKMINTDGSYSSISYDHWTTTTVDENGHMTISITDAFGRLVQKLEFDGADGRSPDYPAAPFSLDATTNYKYDALGNLTSVIDAHNNVTTITYDRLSHKISMNDPDMGNWSYGYDDNGNLLWQKDAKGQAISFKYDALNRLLNKTDAPGTFNVSYNYDDQSQAFGQGRLGSVAYDNGQVGFTYDNLGREISSTKMINGISHGVSRQYDALNRLKQLEYPDSAQVIYLYNQAGQVNGVVDSKALIPPSSSNTARKENVVLAWVEKNIFGVGEAHADVIPPTINIISPPIVNAGGISTVAWSDIANPTSMDWIGLFADGAPDTDHPKWIYVSCSQSSTTPKPADSCDVTIPSSVKPGKYEFRLFANNGYTKLATSTPVTVTPVPPAIINASPAIVNAGAASIVSWSGIVNPTSMDWIGLFAEGAADTAYSKWIYVSCSQTPTTAMAEGSCAFAIPSSLIPGKYEFRLFANNGSTKLATSAPITVALPATLSGSPANVIQGGNSTVSWTNIASPTPMDWIGLFAKDAADTAYSKWMYVSCSQTPTTAQAAGSCAFTIPPSTAPGQYEFRIFANNGSTKLATSELFSVTPAIPAVLSASPDNIDVGGVSTVTWSDISSPSPTDWIGLFANGAADTGYSKWIYVSCTQTATIAKAAGSCEFTIPSSTVPGQYEFRLFANNGFTKLATSAPFTVKAVIPPVSKYVQDIDYNASGQMTQIKYGNGTVTDYTYDPLNLRLKRILTVDADGKKVQDLNYKYDTRGQITSIIDVVNTATQSFKYDARNRLVSANGAGYGNKTYSYDAIGNIKQKDGLNYAYGTNGAGPHAVTSTSDGTIYDYDANGNMKSKQTTQGLWAYAYDAQNRLSSINYQPNAKPSKIISQYSYDGDGGRTKKVVYRYLDPDYSNKDTEDLLETQLGKPTFSGNDESAVSTTVYVGNLYEIEDASSTGAGLRKTKNVYLGSTRIAEITGDEITFYHQDHLGSGNVMTDQAGLVRSLIEYDPFGKISRFERYGGKIKSGWNYFNDKPLDDESGLIYYGARYYDPKLGRFLTPDTIVQAPDNPQTLNRYTYCNNNPVNLIDPSGHFWFIPALIAFAIAHPVITAGIINAVINVVTNTSQIHGPVDFFKFASIGYITGAASAAAGFGISKALGPVLSKAIGPAAGEFFSNLVGAVVGGVTNSVTTTTGDALASGVSFHDSLALGLSTAPTAAAVAGGTYIVSYAAIKVVTSIRQANAAKAAAGTVQPVGTNKPTLISSLQNDVKDQAVGQQALSNKREIRLTILNEQEGVPGSKEIRVRGKAPEYFAGTTSEDIFINNADKYLGGVGGSQELSPGRWVTNDGMRQLRWGSHETNRPGIPHHAHLETYGKSYYKGGKVKYTTTVNIE